MSKTWPVHSIFRSSAQRKLQNIRSNGRNRESRSSIRGSTHRTKDGTDSYLTHSAYLSTIFNSKIFVTQLISNHAGISSYWLRELEYLSILSMGYLHQNPFHGKRQTLLQISGGLIRQMTFVREWALRVSSIYGILLKKVELSSV